MINYPERDPVMPGIQGVFQRHYELKIHKKMNFYQFHEKKHIFKYFFTKFMAISRIFFSLSEKLILTF